MCDGGGWYGGTDDSGKLPRVARVVVVVVSLVWRFSKQGGKQRRDGATVRARQPGKYPTSTSPSTKPF